MSSTSGRKCSEADPKRVNLQAGTLHPGGMPWPAFLLTPSPRLSTRAPKNGLGGSADHSRGGAHGNPWQSIGLPVRAQTVSTPVDADHESLCKRGGIECPEQVAGRPISTGSAQSRSIRGFLSRAYPPIPAWVAGSGAALSGPYLACTGLVGWRLRIRLRSHGWIATVRRATAEVDWSHSSCVSIQPAVPFCHIEAAVTPSWYAFGRGAAVHLLVCEQAMRRAGGDSPPGA